MSIQIVPFDPSHLSAAAELVCQRYRSLRQDVPDLPQGYEQADVFLPMLDSLVQELPAGSGFAYFVDGELAGFLLGMEIPDFMGRRAIFSPEWANAALLDESWRIYEALYTHWSAYWVAQGCSTHLVSLLARDWDAVDAWQWLGFGMAVMDGVRGFEPIPAVSLSGNRVYDVGQPLPDGELQIRQILPEAHGSFSKQDLALVSRFDQALLDHLLEAPCFWPHDAEEAASFSGEPWLTTAGNTLWFAYQGDEPLGYLGITPSSEDACTITRDPGTASIVKAYTLPQARQVGVATALLSHALGWARQQGYARLSVDFEVVNPPARRFWLRWFEPVVITLLREVVGSSGQTTRSGVT